MKEDQTRLRQQNLEAKLMINYHLQAKDVISTKMEVLAEMRKKALKAKQTMMKMKLKSYKKKSSSGTAFFFLFLIIVCEF